MIHCDFCGYDFDPACSTQAGCQACPLSRQCQRIICPRCGYQILPEAGLIRWLRSLRQRIQDRKQENS